MSVRASVTGTGWNAHLENALATAKFGDSIKVPVYIEKGTGSGSITLKATSESDPSKTASAVCTLSDSNVGGSVPATLALTLGSPASFGALTPGLGKDCFATTNASVISTAGDALLTVADPSSTATGHLVNGAFSLPSALQASAQTDATTYAQVGGSATPTPLRSWSGPASNDPGRDQLQADDRLQRRSSHGHLREDIDVHAVHDDALVTSPKAGDAGCSPAWQAKPNIFPRVRFKRARGRDPMADSVYRVTEVIGVSSESWEAAAKAAVATAGKTVRDLRVAEVLRQDVTIEDGGVVNFRVRLAISFKYDSGD